MNSNDTIRRAILAVLSASSAAAVFSPQALAATEPTATDSAGLEEVVVTAQRRTENIQNVPISIQALTGQTLDELKVSTIEDFVKYLPSVTAATMGPGEGNLYMRGLSTGTNVTQGTASVGAWPNVAVYLDDQSTQIPGRNLDVYAADMERVEVLEGPQGTLFGAGAQAGVLRYITNKPKQGVTEGTFNVGYGTTAHGASNSNAEGVLNLPLADNVALRAVVFEESRGGYIDNVFSTFTRRSTDFGIAGRVGGVVPADSVVINNSSIVGKDINPVTYKGLRASVAVKINDDWNVLFSQSYQDMNSNGVFYQMPFGSDCANPKDESTCTTDPDPNHPLVQGKPLDPLQVTLFNAGVTNDKFRNTALTVDGKVGPLSLVYSGTYLIRDSYEIQDYTNYARGVYGIYYQCTGYSGSSVDKCYSPSATWVDTTHNNNQSHELRLSTPTDWKITGIGGVFYEKREVDDVTQWQYKTVPECTVGGPASCFYYLDPSQAPKFAGAEMPFYSRFGPNVGFSDDFTRIYKQSAAYLSLDWHITNSLTLTGGTRYFDISNDMEGGNIGSFYCKSYQATPGPGDPPTQASGPCTGPANGKAPYGSNLSTQNPHSSKATGFKSRVNLSWKPTDTSLIYATWSQGYRPGGFNRGGNCHLEASVPSVTTPGTYTKGASQWCVPGQYDSDNLVNKEIGWKTTFMNNRVQFDGAVYQEDWSNVITGIFAPQLGLGNLTVALNGPTYKVKGVEMSLIVRPVRGLTLQGSMSYNKSELVNSPGLVNNVAGDPNFGQTIDFTYVDAGHPHVPVTQVFGNVGDPLANSPKLQVNARARYEWTMGEHNFYWQIGAVHQGTSFSSATAVNRFEMPQWTSFDGSVGIAKGQWTMEFVAANLTDINESVYTQDGQFAVTEVPQRPRTLGLRFGYKFAGGGQ